MSVFFFGYSFFTVVDLMHFIIQVSYIYFVMSVACLVRSPTNLAGLLNVRKFILHLIGKPEVTISFERNKKITPIGVEDQANLTMYA